MVDDLSRGLARLATDELFSEWQHLCASDLELRAVRRFATATILLTDPSRFLFRVAEAVPAELRDPDPNELWSFELQGTDEAWNDTLQRFPSPGHTDLVAMHLSSADFRVAGDFLSFLQHLRVLTRMFALAREVAWDG